MLQLIGDKGVDFESFKIKRTQLTKKYNTTAAVVNGMGKKGVFEIFEDGEGRLSNYQGEIKALPKLSTTQDIAMQGTYKSVLCKAGCCAFSCSSWWWEN